jgi:SulP family sulfate permease
MEAIDVAIVAAWRSKRLSSKTVLPNITAGVIVGVVALPLAMAFAIASGARPENGLYTSIVAGIIVALFGGSPVQIAGPTGAFIVILAGITAKYGFGGLELATLMAGVLLVAMGVARLGGVIRFIPTPVIAGFTTGIGVVIWVGEWKDFFGLPSPHAANFLYTAGALLHSLPRLQLATTGLALASLAILIGAPKVRGLARVPAPLIALVVLTIAQAAFHFRGVATIGTAFGGIPQTLPAFALPDIRLATVVALIGPAITIALLCAIESLLSAVVADGMAGTAHDSNQELIGQGLANIVNPFAGGFACTGALARTATNVRNGGTNPISGIAHSLFLVLFIVFLAPLAKNVPLAVLAAILFVVAYNMCDFAHFWYIIRSAPRADVAILLVTFTLTIFTTLVIAVITGITLATIQFLRRMARSVDVSVMSDRDIQAELADPAVAVPPGIIVYAIEGPVFFAATQPFVRALIEINAGARVVVLRLRHVPFIDITGLQSLKEVIQTLRKRGVRVILCEANPRVATKLLRAGVITHLGSNAYAADFAGAILRATAVDSEHARDGPQTLSK